MKLTRIEAWATPGWRTFLKRYYDNPGMVHLVLLNPDQVVTYTYKDDIAQPFEPGIQHRVRPL